MLILKSKTRDTHVLANYQECDIHSYLGSLSSDQRSRNTNDHSIRIHLGKNHQSPTIIKPVRLSVLSLRQTFNESFLKVKPIRFN